MELKFQILFCAVLLGWLLAAVLVARRSSFQTYLKYVDALVFPPLVVALVPPAVYVANAVAPWLSHGLGLIPWSEVKTVVAPYEQLVVHTGALLTAAVGAAVILWGWRRFVATREAAVLARREALHGSESMVAG